MRESSAPAATLEPCAGLVTTASETKSSTGGVPKLAFEQRTKENSAKSANNLLE